MHNQMPQEIEVWYIIPALRRELVKSMITDLKLNQKQVAKIMGLTEAAISQYLHSKRAKNVVFTKAVLQEIKKSAQKVAEYPEFLISEMVKLSRLTEVKHIMCDLHKKQSSSLENGCDICFHEEDLIKIKK